MIQIENEGHTLVLYQVEEVAKMLALKNVDDKPIGRNNMFKVLRHNKIITATNAPQQFWLNMGLAVLHTTTKRWKKYTVVCFTEKGIAYLMNGFMSGKFQVHYEPTVRKKRYVDINDIC